MKNLKKAKGITLVALVVTIIVLLILAGVSLSLVAGGNGIIDRASGASDTNKVEAIKEAAELHVAQEVSEYYENKYANSDASTTIATTTTALDYLAQDKRSSHSINHASYGYIQLEYYKDGTTVSATELKKTANLFVPDLSSTADASTKAATNALLVVEYKDGDKYSRVTATVTPEGKLTWATGHTTEDNPGLPIPKTIGTGYDSKIGETDDKQRDAGQYVYNTTSSDGY